MSRVKAPKRPTGAPVTLLAYPNLQGIGLFERSEMLLGPPWWDIHHHGKRQEDPRWLLALESGINANVAPSSPPQQPQPRCRTSAHLQLR